MNLNFPSVEKPIDKQFDRRGACWKVGELAEDTRGWVELPQRISAPLYDQSHLNFRRMA